MANIVRRTYEDIKKANAEAKVSPIKDKPYIEVNERIKAFRKVYPEGFIHNTMVSNDNGICIFRSEVGFYTETGEKRVLGTGTAFENETSNFINKTSYIENCETSACGRALGMAGYGIDISIASYEEVANAITQQGGKVEAEVVKKTPRDKKKNDTSGFPPRSELIDIAKSHYPDGSSNLKALLETFKAESIDKLSDDQLKAIYSKFGGR